MKAFRFFLFTTPLLLAAACVSAPSAAAPAPAPGVSASPVASASPAVSSNATPVAGATAALPPATMDVSPSQVQSGALTLSLSLEKARHMLDQALAMTSDPDPAHQAGAAAGSSTSGSTSLILQGLLQLTNNFNPAQQIPDDDVQSMVRHVSVQVRDTAAGESIPYLAVSLDMLLDGHPAISNVPLVPMVAAEAAQRQLYYGNNLKLILRGTYQVFVRVQPNALLGRDAPPAAQFNVAVH